jgi:branched-chain amino acid transport system substrate-binding protein
MSKRPSLSSIIKVIALGGLGIASVLSQPAAAQKRELLLGLHCDRTGGGALPGNHMCPGFHDYIALQNSKGGAAGFPLRVMEIDHEYKIPLAIEAHERFLKEGAIAEGLYGTPTVAALTKRLEDDKIVGSSPGFGIAAAASGKRFPYLFPSAASFWSQAAGAVVFVKQELGGSLKGKKIAFLFFDNPAGREPLAILEDIAKAEGFELKSFGVPAPGLEMGAQILDLTSRFRPDYVIANLFGRAPGVSIKELKSKGYPLTKVIGLGWGVSEADITLAGGMTVAEGFRTVQFTGVGIDYPVIREINQLYASQGKAPPKQQEISVYYNRGVLMAALLVEAISNAVKANGGNAPTREQIKAGMESIAGFTLGGFVPPLKITPEDHEGGGWIQIWTVKDGRLQRTTDWLRGYSEVIQRHLASQSAN